MTGCDSNNGFMAIERIRFIIGSAGSHLPDLIIDVTKELPLSVSVCKVMKTFVIQAIYGDNKSKTRG